MLTEDESKRLFFSVGRSRRVYPREILGLINAKTAIAREDIGAIRILDNYSFVQVRDTVAEKIIEALNGVTFRGRTLAVNYAKFRKEEENGGGGNGSDPESEDGTAEAGTDTEEQLDQNAEKD
jgi:RNA recognition motif-containing protein